MDGLAAVSGRHAAWLARCHGRGELAPFGGEEIDELAATVGVDQVRAGAPLMREGRLSESVVVIRHGQVELYRRAGIRRVVLQVLHDGDVFGDVPFLCGMPVPFGARALTDAQVIRLSPSAFWRLLETRPQLCRRFLFSLASRLERTQRRLLELTSGTLQQQLAALLLDESGGEPGQIDLSQSTLAELLGASRPSVNRALKTFEAGRLVELGYRRITVVDVAGLTAARGTSGTATARRTTSQSDRAPSAKAPRRTDG